jgi:branched-chain amino acid transport system ATP-binding protein
VSGTLVARGISAGYGDITAVWDLSLTVAPGKIVAVLGRNGAGKTTTLAALAGLLPLSRGVIELDGRDITGLPAYRRVDLGVSLVPENKQIFRQLSVEKNLMVGAYSLRRSRRAVRQAVVRELERFPTLGQRRHHSAGSLSGGQQQMLAIAQALVAQPSVLMLDEPSAGLAPTVVSRVFDTVVELKRDGIAILLVEQLAELALEIADEVVVLDVGHVVLRHDAAEGRDLKVLEAAYFGRG